MGDFVCCAFYRHQRGKINIAVAITFVLVFIWPVPVIVSRIEASRFQHKCEGWWQGNAASFKKMEAAKNAVDYVGSGLTFTDSWTGNMRNLADDLYCFQNLYPDHLLAIQHFEGALLEYSRQSSLANFDMAPPVFDYPQFSKVEYRCQAPELLKRRWTTWCQTFLNVP